MIANGPVSTFTPIIIAGFGYSTLNSLLLLMPMGAYSGTMQLLFPYLAYKYKGIRCWLIFIAQMITTVASILLCALPGSARGGLLFACILMPSVAAGYAVMMGLQIANTAGYTKRSIASSGLYMGYCIGMGPTHACSQISPPLTNSCATQGNFVGPLIFREKDAPRYVPGFIAVVVTAFLAGVLAVVYRFVCVRDNKKRDGAGIMEGFDHAYEDDLTDGKVRKAAPPPPRIYE